MYEIKNLNIWKASSDYYIFRYTDKVLYRRLNTKGEEISMSDKCQKVFDEILTLVPTANFSEIKKRRGGRLRFPIFINEKLRVTDLEALELSVRSINCLHRVGYRTIGDLVEAIESSEDLKKIRNCGAKSIDEIMENLFCYQYCQIDVSGRINYINNVLELNNIK